MSRVETEVLLVGDVRLSERRTDISAGYFQYFPLPSHLLSPHPAVRMRGVSDSQSEASMGQRLTNERLEKRELAPCHPEVNLGKYFDLENRIVHIARNGNRIE